MITATLISLIAVSLISIITIATEERSRQTKIALIVLVFVALLFGGWNSVISHLESKEIGTQRDSLKIEVDSLRILVSSVQEVTKNLGKLHELTGSWRYDVQIASDTNRDNLIEFQKNIENMFDGAKESDQVDIVPHNKAERYYLIFGKNLDMVSAEIFQRLALNHNFAPPNQFPKIRKHVAEN